MSCFGSNVVQCLPRTSYSMKMGSAFLHATRKFWHRRNTANLINHHHGVNPVTALPKDLFSAKQGEPRYGRCEYSAQFFPENKIYKPIILRCSFLDQQSEGSHHRICILLNLPFRCRLIQPIMSVFSSGASPPTNPSWANDGFL
jgi:hypothetical protein